MKRTYKIVLKHGAQEEALVIHVKAKSAKKAVKKALKQVIWHLFEA
jgi:hemerythrin superfamily protein